MDKLFDARMDSAAMQALADAVPYNIAVVDRGHNIVFVNQEFCNLYAMAAVDIVGRHLRRQLGERIYALFAAMDESVFGQGKTQLTERWIDVPGLGERFLELRVVPYRDAAGAITMAFSIPRLDQGQAERTPTGGARAGAAGHRGPEISHR